jgi:CDGSH-type Zn-finger protein
MMGVGAASADEHQIAGRMFGASGVATLCTCGLAFFAPYTDGTSQVTGRTKHEADRLWSAHEESTRPPGGDRP